jgi:hypothetical protein
MDEDTIPDHIDPQHTHVPRQVLQMCQELSDVSMFDAFGKRKATMLSLRTCAHQLYRLLLNYLSHLQAGRWETMR